MAARHGLQLLHEGDNPIADIIFVHGLFGDPQGTWTGSDSTNKSAHTLPGNHGQPGETNAARATVTPKRMLSRFWRRSNDHEMAIDIASQQVSTEPGVFWPKELLPRATPQTRIYTWGYDVDINHVFSNASQATVFQHAGTLLSDIANTRNLISEKHRPLIFVAHSLGGIVVKDMLNASRNEVTYLKDVLPSSYGIIFLGTPHRGSSTATLGKIAQDITKVLWKSPNMSVLRDLEVNSQTLDRVSRGFNQILVDNSIQIHSFREELPTNGIMVVNQFSSALENGREVLDMIPANHKNMTKFSSPFDVGFIRIVATLTRWLDDIKSKSSINSVDLDNIGKQFTDKVDDLHSWLSPVPFDLELTRLLARRATNPPDHLLDDSVSGWSRSDRGLLQITGDPGYGKTMFAATLIEQVLSSVTGEGFVGYAFCLKLSVNTVLQGIIWQIVQSSHLTLDQKRLVLEAHRNRRRTLEGDQTTQSERQETLDLRNLVAKLLQPCKSVTLVFDGIDRITSSEDAVAACISNIVDSLLHSAKPLKLVITSRLPPRGLQRVNEQLGLYTLGLTTRSVTHDVEIYMRQSLSSLEPPLNIDVDTLVIPKCLEAAADGWPDFMYALATKYVKLGRPNEAEALALETLSFREARQREDAKSIIVIKRLLAWIMANQGRRGEAEELQRSILETTRRTKGHSDSLVNTLTNDLSLTLMDQDGTIEQRKEAIALLEQIVDAWKTPEGEETEKSLTVLNNLAVAYMDSDVGRLEEAEALLHRVIRGSELLHGGNDQQSLGEKSNLAQLFARQKKWAEAEKLGLEVLEIRKRTLGMDNPVTIQCLSSIGWVYSQQEDRLQEAKTIQSEVLERRMRVQGATHPDTIGIIGNLAETLSKLGEMREARRYARMALGY